MLFFLFAFLSLDSILDQPVLEHAQVGVIVIDLDEDSVVYSRNHQKLLVPASNMKIVTSASAICFLGRDFRYVTRLAVSGRLHSGRLEGDIIVFGGGDPNFSLSDLERFVSATKNTGISRIDGNIILVDDYFTGERLPIGWAWHYLDARYAAEISALSVNRNVVNVHMAATRPGQNVNVSLQPETDYIRLISTMATRIGDDSIVIYREPEKNMIHVRGWLGNGRVRDIEVAVIDPTMYFGEYFKERLRAAGIVVRGTCVRAESGSVSTGTKVTVIDSVVSVPMSEIVRELNTESVNLIGETVLKTLGSVFRREGSFRAGASVMKEFLKRCGVDTTLVQLYDGSGLSRYNLISPFALALVLRRMYHSKYFQDFYGLLPGPGQGTLTTRLNGLKGMVRAKSGTLDAISCLSGYLEIGGHYYCFSMMFNNFVSPRKTVEAVQEDLLRVLRTYLEVKKDGT